MRGQRFGLPELGPSGCGWLLKSHQDKQRGHGVFSGDDGGEGFLKSALKVATLRSAWFT